MNIKIIGSNCSNGIKLKKEIKKAINEKDLTNVQVEELNDHDSLRQYKIKNMPGLVIDEKVVSQGRVLGYREILRLVYD